jgi:ABC-type glycerol-3-phosphate transport system permease component
MKTTIKKKIQVIDVAIFALLTIFSLTLLLLLAWGVLTSFKSYDDFTLFNNIIGLPNLEAYGAQDALAFGNYRRVLFSTVFHLNSSNASYYSALFGYIENSPNKVFVFGDYLFNSFLYSIVCSFVHAFVAFTCAYLCAKYKFRFSEFIYVLMLVVMAIPIVGSSPAMVSLLRDLGIHDTIFAMVALNFNFTGIYFFVFHAYLTGISDTYVEAAEIDGASQLGVFIKIIFPLCLKTFFTVFLLQFIQTWNDYQTPLLYYPNHPTLAYAVFRMTNNTGGADKGMEYQGVPQRVAGCMVLAIPIFAIFVAFNKLLMGNLTMGGLKE